MALNNQTSAAYVETAVPVSEPEKKELVALVQKIGGSGSVVEFKINPKLLGGFTIAVGDRKIDASVKGELQQLTRILKG